MDSIDSEQKAYWLGFFYADAYNNEKRGRVVIELTEKDKEHLNKCAKFFGKPREPFKQIKKDCVSYRLELNSRHLTQNLKNKGCPQNKSKIIKFPKWLDKSLIRHFIRGYFDGDGSIYLDNQDQLQINIVSTKNMISEIKRILAEQNINSYIGKSKSIWRLQSGGNKQIKNFCDWIYSDASIFLLRKHKIYLQCL